MKKYTVACDFCGFEEAMMVEHHAIEKALMIPRAGWEKISGEDICQECVKKLRKRQKNRKNK